MYADTVLKWPLFYTMCCQLSFFLLVFIELVAWLYHELWQHCYCHRKSWANYWMLRLYRPWRCNRGLWHLWVCVCTGENGIYTGIYLQNKTQSLWKSLTCILKCPKHKNLPQVSCRSLARLETIQDMHTTIYDVIRHAPESPSQSLLE